MLKNKIDDLKQNIRNESEIVKEMIKLAVDGLVEKKAEKLQRVMELEDKVNENEIYIDEKCIALIALQQPEAKDLRTITMIMNMNSELERMGDLAANIAKHAQYLIKKTDIDDNFDLIEMAKETLQMVHHSISAFVTEDSKLAREVCLRDDIVDKMQDSIFRVLITYMMDDTSTIKRAIRLNRIANCLERMADLSTNIAEDTIYISEGKVIKHGNE